jgi:hypothetical protein
VNNPSTAIMTRRCNLADRRRSVVAKGNPLGTKASSSTLCFSDTILIVDRMTVEKDELRIFMNRSGGVEWASEMTEFAIVGAVTRGAHNELEL